MINSNLFYHKCTNMGRILHRRLVPIQLCPKFIRTTSIPSQTHTHTHTHTHTQHTHTHTHTTHTHKQEHKQTVLGKRPLEKSPRKKAPGKKPGKKPTEKFPRGKNTSGEKSPTEKIPPGENAPGEKYSRGKIPPVKNTRREKYPRGKRCLCVCAPRVCVYFQETQLYLWFSYLPSRNPN